MKNRMEIIVSNVDWPVGANVVFAFVPFVVQGVVDRRVDQGVVVQADVPCDLQVLDNTVVSVVVGDRSIDVSVVEVAQNQVTVEAVAGAGNVEGRVPSNVAPATN